MFEYHQKNIDHNHTKQYHKTQHDETNNRYISECIYIYMYTHSFVFFNTFEDSNLHINT